ncbi:EamA-like transporter family protein [Polystyrenella longa]|uniref:EamA-like transporter family protein n=1 Tax=Polystyrenella longa TaxID=2528007 RepID=A0A518CIP3_9PLAN|nr:DMT family transporter [Polystyrenella longa]QDU79105.1 EamA-like transporter family protein [Polystyrenella longa]
MTSATSSRNLAPLGIALGFLSAICYSIANSMLNNLADTSDFDWAVWVTCIKAVPATILSWVVLAHRRFKGLSALPPKELFWPMIGFGLIMQFGGNVCFQYSLSYGGLALSVPLCFASIILSSAWLSWFWLKETLQMRTVVSIVLLLTAVVLLGMATQEATAANTYLDQSSIWTTIIAIGAATVAGISYGTSGVAIRHCLKKQVSLAGTLVWLSTVGVVALGIYCVLRMETAEMLAATPSEWRMMAYAGIFNAIAFFAIGAAMKYITVVQANLVNTSQIAMCGMIAVFLFGEPMTFWLCCGTLLTMIALFILRPPRPKNQKGEALKQSEESPNLIPEPETGSPLPLGGVAQLTPGTTQDHEQPYSSSSEPS